VVGQRALQVLGEAGLTSLLLVCAAFITWYGLAIVVWLMTFVVPPTVGFVRSLRYGSLRPGRPIREITRPRRAKVLSGRWTDGRTATYVEVPGLTEELRRKVSTDGQPGVHIP
jgi:hypothetical protein